MKKTFFIFCFLISIFSIFQNCSVPKVQPVTKLSIASCGDIKSEFKIIKSQNSNPYQFSVYYKNVYGDFILFEPEESTSQWPPHWFKDNTPSLPQELLNSGAIFQTDLPSTCNGTKIKAEMNLCGEDIIIEESFSDPVNCIQACSEYGVTATEGNSGRFYRSTEATCDEDCQYIDRVCTRDSNGSLLFLPNNTEYNKPSCTPVNPLVCNGFEEEGCTAPPNNNLLPLSWAWPNFPSNSTLEVQRGNIISVEFTASSHSMGMIDTTGYPISPGDGGYEGRAVLSISKSAGCLDPEKLPDFCVSIAKMPSIPWQSETGTSPYACKLRAGEKYRINLYFGNSSQDIDGNPFCPGDICGRRFNNSFNP